MSLDTEAREAPITARPQPGSWGSAPRWCMLTWSESRFPITA